jgi:hypothetical protein
MNQRSMEQCTPFVLGSQYVLFGVVGTVRI